MYASTSAEEAASQSNPNQTTKVVSDLVKNNVPRINFVEGDNWVRFINPYKNPWYIGVGFYKMHRGDKVARVIHQELFGQPNLFRTVQIYLYQNPETKPYMWTMDNPEGFRFDEQRRALLVAAKFENTLGQFGIAQVTLGRPRARANPTALPGAMRSSICPPKRPLILWIRKPTGLCAGDPSSTRWTGGWSSAVSPTPARSASLPPSHPLTARCRWASSRNGLAARSSFRCRSTPSSFVLLRTSRRASSS